LGKEYARNRRNHFDPQEIIKTSKVFKRKASGGCGDECGDLDMRTPGNNDIINIY